LATADIYAIAQAAGHPGRLVTCVSMLPVSHCALKPRKWPRWSGLFVNVLPVDTRTGFFSPLRHASFRSIWGASTLSLMAFWMTEVASAWQMRLMTDADPLLVASVYTVLQLPILLFVIPAGVITDLLDRRRIMIWTHVWLGASLAVLALLILSGSMTPLLLLLCLPLISLGQAIRMPGLSTLIPDMVHRREIPAAVSLNSIAQNASRVIGPALAGALIGLVGVAAVLGVNAMIMTLVALIFLRLRYSRAAGSGALSWPRFRDAINEGLHFAASTRWTRNILLRLGTFFACSASVPALMAVRFDDSVTYGLMYGCFGAGSLLGMIAIGWLGHRRLDARLSVGLLLCALCIVLLGLTDQILLSAALLLLVGATWVFCSNSIMVAAQMQLAPEMRGRGLSFVYAVGTAGLACGGLIWGIVARTTSPATSLVVAGLCLLAILALTHRLPIAAPPQVWQAKHVDA